MFPKVSIITVNYNSEKYLRKCFYSIANQDYPKDALQIILVDNDSKDGSREYVKIAYPNVKVVNSGYNAGYSGGANIGYERTTGEYVALMANDMIFPENWIRSMVDFLEKNKKAAVVTATMVNGEITKSAEGELLNTSPVLVGRADTKHTGYTVVPWGGACIFRKRLFDIPFDSDYFIYGEDVYLGLMSWLRGYKVIENKIKVAHMGSVTVEFFSKTQVHYNERNRITNLISFFKPETLILLAPLAITDIAIKLAYFLKSKRPDLVNAELSAIWHNIKNIKKIVGKRSAIQMQRKVQDNKILEVLCENLYGNGGKKEIINMISISYFRLVKKICKIFGV